jgi:hypothetical protein
MQRPVESQPLPTSQSFAGSLATVATKRAGEAGANHHEIRSVSVTVRLSKAECSRLHERAAEAGVTVSAYMRSCAFKAEAPRAQVKEAPIELKLATSKENADTPARKSRSWFGPLTQLFPHRNSAERTS